MSSMIPTLGGKSQPLAQNAGVPVLGNTGTKNPNNVIPGQSSTSPISLAVQGARNTSTPATTPQASTPVPLTTTSNPPGTDTSASGTTTTSSTPTPSSNPILAGYTQQQTNQLRNQLVNIYGKGEGGLLFNLLNGMGGSDNAYMQAYAKAMAPVNAENLATLNTTLGNSGVSANSSTAAIANADFESNVTSQEALVEQNLLQSNIQDTIGITTGIEDAAQKEVSESWYNDLGDVLEAVGNFVTFRGNKVGAASQSASPQAQSPQSVPQSTQAGTDTDPNASSTSTGTGDDIDWDSPDSSALNASSADAFDF
jgi:hypothetical protein